MIKNFEQFIEVAKTLRLTGEEKGALKKSLISFIAAHPARSGFRISYFFASLRIRILRPVFIFLIAALFLTGGVGIAFAAEGTLPGDTLYPVKIYVNEKLVATFALTAETKAKWETRIAERRLEEAEQLLVEIQTEAEILAQLRASFGNQAERVNDRMAEFEARGDHEIKAEISSRFETSLKAHEKILTKLSAGREDGQEEQEEAIQELIWEVRTQAETSSSSRVQAENEVSTHSQTEIKAAAEGKLGAAENKIAEVESFLGKLESRIGVAAAAQAQAKLDTARGTVAQGKAKLESESFGEAFVLFQQALRQAQEAQLALEASEELNVDIEFGESKACIQVITPARNEKTGEIKNFPTPCEVPEGWEKVEGAKVELRLHQ